MGMKANYVNPIRRGDMLQCRYAGEKRYGFMMFVGDEEHATAVRKLINRTILEGGMAMQYRVMRESTLVYPK